MYYGIYSDIYPFYRIQGKSHKISGYRMTVNGRGKVNACPDRASIVLGVITEGIELKSIQIENAERMTEVIRLLKNMGVDENNMKTQYYSIDPVYEHMDGTPFLKGYRVRNALNIVINNIQMLGDIIDNSVSKGANIVESINFVLSNESEYRRMALSLAVEDAMENAKAIGNSLNALVAAMPLSVTEESSSFIPLSSIEAFKSYGTSTPLKPGMIEITSSVQVVVPYCEQ